MSLFGNNSVQLSRVLNYHIWRRFFGLYTHTCPCMLTICNIGKREAGRGFDGWWGRVVKLYSRRLSADVVSVVSYLWHRIDELSVHVHSQLVHPARPHTNRTLEEEREREWKKTKVHSTDHAGPYTVEIDVEQNAWMCVRRKDWRKEDSSYGKNTLCK